MIILRDDFSEQADRCLMVETSAGAELYAKLDSDNTFFVSFSEQGMKRAVCGSDGWWFGTESCDDAIAFFTRLKTILENGEI